MRTFGRVSGQWVEVTETTAVWVTTLVQCLKLQQNESPFFANYGLPARESVQSQIAPDAAVARTQAQFARYFSSLTVKVIPADKPTYAINAVRPDGSPVTEIAT